MIGSYLQEFIRPASDSSGQDIKRIDYLSFPRVEGRWKYVSIDLRVPVGIMPAYSFDRGDAAGVVLVHDTFAIAGGVRRGGAKASANWSRPSTSVWTITMSTLSPSSGPPLPPISSKKSPVGEKR